MLARLDRDHPAEPSEDDQPSNEQSSIHRPIVKRMNDADKQSDDYERFESLARRLAQVPKKELDDLEAKTDPSDKPSDDASEDPQA